MYEIRIHGRGGQGAVLAAKMLAKALGDEGKFVKAVPAFGFERRGAPVASYLRCDDKLIRQTTNIYHPDCIVCLDPTLPRVVDIFAGMNPKGTLVHTTKKSIDELILPQTISKVGLCDAFGIALRIFGRAITNSIMLGAFAKTTGMVSLDAVCAAMQATDFRDAALEKNIEASKEGYEKTTVYSLGKEGVA
jgi:phenylglyoxylate dehydrogenase gamma subunit